MELPEEAVRRRELADKEKQTMRASLDSFREVANKSARTAVATSQASKVETALQIKVSLTVVCLMFATFTLSTPFWLSSDLSTFGWVAMILAGIMGAEVARTCHVLRQLSRHAAGDSEPPETVNPVETANGDDSGASA